jgi:SIR2-like domain
MQLTWLTEPTKSAYLHPLLEKARTTRLVIATLNYDNSVEIAAEALNIQCHTLGDWQDTAILPEPSVGIDLLKLHGSANWKWSDRPSASADITPPRAIQEVSSGDMRMRLSNAKLYVNSDYIGESLGVLFGGGNKLTAEGPFIDLFHKFKRLLWGKQHLLVIGYSFRDDHINDIIEHWFVRKQDTTVTIVEKENLDKNENRFYRSHQDEIDERLFYDNSGVEKALLKY